MTGGLYRPAGGNLIINTNCKYIIQKCFIFRAHLPRVEMVGLREWLGLKDLTLDLGVVEVDREGF